MAITLFRLDNDAGMKAVLDEPVLREMGFDHRLRRGEEIEMVLAVDPEGKGLRIHVANPDERTGSVLRLRSDGKAEVVFC